MTGSERPTESIGLRVTPTRKKELDSLKEELGFKEMTELLRVMIEDYLERRRNGPRMDVNRPRGLDIESTCTLFREFLENRLSSVDDAEQAEELAMDLTKRMKG